MHCVKGSTRLVLGMMVALAMCSGAFAAEEPAAEEGLPLPLHTVEGVGGLVLTPTAYLVNPGPEDELFGDPSVSAQAAWIGDRDLQVLAATWTLYGRIELGYAASRLGLDDFDRDVRRMTAGTTTVVVPGDGVDDGDGDGDFDGGDMIRTVRTPGADIRTNDIWLHHFNARLNAIREGEWDLAWMPAVTAGIHYKYNNDIHEINRQTGRALETIGYNDNDGIDFTLTASKTVTALPRPVIVTAGARASKASQIGFVGFGDDYLVTFEGSVLVLATDRLAVGAEYRQKKESLDEIPGLINNEDSWWDVHAAYILNNNAEVYAVLGNAGAVLNHSDETLWGVVFKYEF